MCDDEFVELNSVIALNNLAAHCALAYTSYTIEYKESTFLRGREFGTDHAIAFMKPDDYFNSIQPLNLLCLAKKYCTLAHQDKTKTYWCYYDGDSRCVGYEIFNDESEIDEFIKENFGD